MVGYILRTVAFLVAWVLAEPKARAARTPDLANISAERVSALETAERSGRGGLFEGEVVVSGVHCFVLATA